MTLISRAFDQVSQRLANNNFYDNLLPAERSTFGQQVYNGQKPTFFTNNVMQMTYDLSRYGISDGQIVVGGIYNYHTWEPAGPNAFSLATLSYYQTFPSSARDGCCGLGFRDFTRKGAPGAQGYRTPGERQAPQPVEE